jgi:hypothetical protein
MVAKAVWATILAIGVLAVSGLGFAAFTSLATVQTTSTAGTLSVGWANAAVSGDGNTYTTCAVSFTGANLYFNASTMAPGDWCMVFGNLTNTGNVGASYSIGTTTSVGFSNCFSWDQISATNGTVGPGSNVAFQASVGVLSSAGNSCQGQIGTVTSTITASAANVQP